MSLDEVRTFWTDTAQKDQIDIDRKTDPYSIAWDRAEKRWLLESIPPGLVLDLGCGTGRLARFMRARGREVVGVDYVPACLTKTREHVPIHCATMSVQTLGFTSGSFDSLVACRVLQSLPTVCMKLRVIQEAWRVLKQDGTLLLVEGNSRVLLCRPPYNFYLDRGTWKGLLRSCGFDVRKILGTPYTTLLQTLNLVLRRRLNRLPSLYGLSQRADVRFGAGPTVCLSQELAYVAVKARYPGPQ